MIKPVLTVEDVSTYMPQGITEKVFLLGIRGWGGENKIGVYDDAIFLVTPGSIIGYNANTDPSRLLKGVASLVPGTYYYKKGLHGLHHLDLTKSEDQKALNDALKTGKDVSSLTYWAYRQNSDVTVIREGDTIPHADSVENRFWIDIHRGGYNTTSSAGCQTVHPDQWSELKSKGYAAMDAYKEQRIPYILAIKK